MKPVIMNNITHCYGDKPVLKNFSLELIHGEVTCLLGPSGSGKTTVLNILAGLVEPDSGQLDVDSYTVSCVFQELRLLPWRSVMGNLAFVMKGQIPSDRMDARLEEMLKIVEMWDERHSWPHQLSGGMKQRVALARALAVPATILLLDEPFKGLDIALRERIMNRCKDLWKREDQTVLLVTHDPAEAGFLATRTINFKERQSGI